MDVQETMPSTAELSRRYDELRRYINLTGDDVQLVISAWPLVRHDVADHIDDFYNEILHHQDASVALTGGEQQVNRLKATLTVWIEELFVGVYDLALLQRRWMIGWRHVKIGLSQKWTAAAMSRLRDQINRSLARRWKGDLISYQQTVSAITRAMDLDLALIQDAYYAESVARRLQGERDFAEAIIGTTESIVIVAKSDGTILRHNRFVAKLVSDQDTLPGAIRSVQQLIDESECSKLVQLVSDAGDDSSIGPILCPLVDAQKRPRTVRWFCKAIQYPESPDSLELESAKLLVGHDVTDWFEAQRRSVQQERLAAIGQTMTGLAHESRNAFQRSQASLEMLALEVSDKPDAVALIERIQRAHDHLLHLYEEVLSFAKPVRLDLKKHRLSGLLARTWSHIVTAQGCELEQMTIVVDCEEDDAVCDAHAIEQILRNLIENALVVSPDDKPVEVSIQNAWQGDQPALKIVVVDHGPGIPEGYQERIFEPFFSTRSRGTGLGLPIARRLAVAHGGSLELRSSEKGAEAVLVIPKQSSGDATIDPESRPDYRLAPRGEASEEPTPGMVMPE